jgi:hypothetical protein
MPQVSGSSTIRLASGGPSRRRYASTSETSNPARIEDLRLDQDRRRKLGYKGQQRNRAWFLLTTATYNILRITALDASTG